MNMLLSFLSGIALLSCLPGVVEAGAEGHPKWFLIGGLCGLLPGMVWRLTNLCRYRQDMTITPDPLAFDAQLVADGIATAVRRVFSAEGPVRLKLNALQLSEKNWLRYDVTFDVAGRRVLVTGGTGGDAIGSAELPGNIRLDHLARISVTEVDGPLFSFERVGETSVVPRIINNPAGRFSRRTLIWLIWLMIVLILWNLSGPERVGPVEALNVARVLAISALLPAGLGCMPRKWEQSSRTRQSASLQ